MVNRDVSIGRRHHHQYRRSPKPTDRVPMVNVIVKSIIATVDDDKLCWQVSLPTRKVAGTQDEFDVDYMVATTPPLKVEPALLHTHTQACTHARSQRAHACA